MKASASIALPCSMLIQKRCLAKHYEVNIRLKQCLVVEKSSWSVNLLAGQSVSQSDSKVSINTVLTVQNCVVSFLRHFGPL